MTLSEAIDVTILMPCLNESETLATCIAKAKNYLSSSVLRGEELFADNGSVDGSIEIAKGHGARVVRVGQQGYGAALMEGIKETRGRYIVMGDADDSYDFSNLAQYIDKLTQGSDIVMGNRFAGGIKKGAMPFLHRYLGNPVLSFLGMLFFKIRIRDLHCGLRGFKRDSILRLHLETPGMEFASKMVVRASLAGLAISEVSTTLAPDGRSPHLNTWKEDIALEFFSDEANLNLLTKRDLRSLIQPLDGFSVRIASVSLMSWPSNLIVSGRRS